MAAAAALTALFCEGFGSGVEEVVYSSVCVALPSSLPFTAGKLLGCVFHLSADIDVIILKVIHFTSQSPSSWSRTSKQLQSFIFVRIKSGLKLEKGLKFKLCDAF